MFVLGITATVRPEGAESVLAAREDDASSITSFDPKLTKSYNQEHEKRSSERINEKEKK